MNTRIYIRQLISFIWIKKIRPFSRQEKVFHHLAVKTNAFSTLRPLAFATMVAIGLMIAPQTHATTAYWNVNGTTTYATTTNWSLNSDGTGTVTTVPGAGDIANFGSINNNAATTATLGADLSVGGLVFTNIGTTALNPTNNTLRTITIGSSGINVQAGAGAVTFGNGGIRPISIALGASQTWTNDSSNTLTFNYSTSTPTSLSLATNTLTISGSGATTINDPISGSGAIIKNGSGTLILSGSNTYTGTTTIGAGTLQANVTDAAGSGALGNGGSITFTGGTLKYTANSASTDYASRFRSSTSAIALDTNGQSVTLAGAIDSTNTGGFTKLGSGVLTLSGSNAYTGTTSINAGSISVASITSNLGGTGAINIGATTSSGTLIYTGTGSQTVTRAINLAGSTGGATITNNSGTSAGALTFSGNFGATGAGIKTLTLNGSSSAQNIISGTISNFDGTNTTSVLVSGGDWTLSGSNTFSGGVTLSSGKLRVGNDGALGTGTFTLAGGTWNPSGNHTIANNIVISADSNGNDGSSTTDFTGQITGNGNWTVNGFAAGKMKLSGDNSGWTGSYRIAGQNTLQLNNAHALGSGTTFTFSDNASTMGTLESLVAVSLGQNFVLGATGTSTNFPIFKTTADMTITGTISGPSGIGLIKTGTGKLTLGSAGTPVTQTYTGLTTVSAGTLVINGTVGSGGITVNSGATLGGNLTAGGTTTISAGAILAVGNSPGLGTFEALNLSGTTEIQFSGGATPAGRGTTFDAITVTGSNALVYGGTLKLIFAGAIAGNQTFDIFDLLGTASGDFTGVTLFGSGTSANLTLASGTWSGGLDLGYGGGLQTFAFSQTTGNLSVIPEPQTWALVGLGLGFILLRLRSSNRREP